MLGYVLGGLALLGGGVYWWEKKHPTVVAPMGVSTAAQLAPSVGTTAIDHAELSTGAPIYSGPKPPFSFAGASVAGAWQHNAAYIRQYQGALTYLAHMLGDAALNPQGVDGIFGAHTQSAVEHFQFLHSLTQDGKAGAQTAAALTLAVGAA
jgi:hypothetical protein